MGCPGLPEFGSEETGEAMLPGDSGHAGLGEWRGVVGEAGGAQTGEEAEGEVQAADKGLCGEAHEAVWDTEVGDEPKGSWSEGWNDACDESVEFGLGEAVEEEMGDDEVVSVVFLLEREVDCVGVMGAEASIRIGRCCFAALAEEVEHSSADVNCVGLELRVVNEELGEKSSVSVA